VSAYWLRLSILQPIMPPCPLFVSAQISRAEEPTIGSMEAITALTQCADVPSLRSELHALCSVFGPVSRLDILPTPGSGNRQVVCFIRLASSEQESRMMSQLGVQRFGNDMFMVLDLAN
jgi:hypothetical protein